jgi:hypothetical protein
MAFDLMETSGLEIYFVSKHDPAVDWEKTRVEKHFSRDDYEDDPNEERAKSLICRPGQEPTIFYLSIPEPKAINKALREYEGIAAIQFVAKSHILRVENLTKGGKSVVLARRKGMLTDEAENMIPTPVLHEIGDFLVRRGGGLDSPF